MTTKTKQKINNSYLQSKKDDIEEVIEVPEYSDDERTYLKILQKRLADAKLERDKPRIEFDNLTFEQYWYVNEQKANTELESVKNKIDTPYQSGTLRTKMLAFLSSDVGYSFQANITAYDENNIEINRLGNAMENIIEKTEELENDEEWQMLRLYEKMKHGYVFVEDLWDDNFVIDKSISGGSIGEKSKIRVSSTRKNYLGQPRRKIISGLSVYLGDYSKYMIEDQPYIYTVTIENYETLEQTYKEWEMWKYVSRTPRSFSGHSADGIISNKWSLYGSKLGKDRVEVIRYQDKPHNEFQLIFNGVPMLPIGFPLTEISPDGEYTIVQQNLEPIRHNFAIGKSFIFKNKNLIAILDEMMKMGVFRSQQAAVPPSINLSDRVVSRSIFMPGQMSRGLKPGDIQPVMQDIAKGISASEFEMMNMVKSTVDENTVSQTFTGQREKGSVTATQIVEIQRQARIMMGLLTLSSKLLEKKLDSKRLMIILSKWFDPIDKDLDEVRQMLKNKYRRVSVNKTIENEGPGIEMVIPTDTIPQSSQIKEYEEQLSNELGKPVRTIMLNPKELRKAKLTWVLTVNSKPQRTTELSKLLFSAEMADAKALGLQLNPEYVQQRFAEVWDEDPSRLFLSKKEAMATQQGGQQMGMQEQQRPETSASFSPKVSLGPQQEQQA